MEYFDYDDTSEIRVPDLEVEGFLNQFQEWETEQLHNELKRITNQLDARDALHNDAVDDLTSKLEWYVDRLKMLYKRGQGHHEERDQLKDRIEHMYAELRKEKRHHWRDRQDLEQERRDVLRDLDENISLVDLLE